MRRYALPDTDGVTIDQSSPVMLVRYQGNVCALALACPHQRAAVRWVPKEQRFQCSKHDSKYQPNGTYTSGRATRNLDRFPIQREGQSVLVDVTRVYKSDQDMQVGRPPSSHSSGSNLRSLCLLDRLAEGPECWPGGTCV